MKMDYPDLSKIEKDFVEKLVGNYPKDYSVKVREVCLYVAYPQVWSSSALGFDDEPGCDGLTTGFTTIMYAIVDGAPVYGIYYGERLAEILKNTNKRFFEDIQKRKTYPKSKLHLYLEKSCNC